MHLIYADILKSHRVESCTYEPVVDESGEVIFTRVTMTLAKMPENTPVDQPKEK